MRLIERFKRADENTLLYEYGHRPKTFTRPFTVAMDMTKNDAII